MSNQKADDQPSPDFSFLNENGAPAPSAPSPLQEAETPAFLTANFQTAAGATIPQADTKATLPPAIDLTSASARTGKASPVLSVYAVAVTALLVGLIATGRVSLFGTSPLESLPDLKPLDQNEFQRIPEGTSLPAGHVLKLGESRRFGDVVVTPVKLTREPLEFAHFQSGKIEERMTTSPIVKLWLSFENVARDYAFTPLEVSHISHRSPPSGNDEQTLANSFLQATSQVAETSSQRFLNYLHAPDSNYVIKDQNTGTLIKPGETLTIFIPCSENLTETQLATIDQCVWRVQFRKGVHLGSGHGVTTLIDVPFTPADISTSPQTQL